MTIIDLSYFRKNELELLSILSSHEENVPAGAGWARTPAPPGPRPPGGQGHSPGTVGGMVTLCITIVSPRCGRGRPPPCRAVAARAAPSSGSRGWSAASAGCRSSTPPWSPPSTGRLRPSRTGTEVKPRLEIVKRVSAKWHVPALCSFCL